MSPNNSEIGFPEEANTHLEQMADAQHRAEVAERLGRLSIISPDQVTSPLEHHSRYDTVEGQPSPYDQSERTTGLIAGIAQRANSVSAEMNTAATPEAASSETLWDRLLESQLTDIDLSRESGDKEKTEGLITEHMVSLQLAEAGDEWDRRDHEEQISNRAKASMLRLTEMGLVEETVEASRGAYGLVVATTEKPDTFDGVKKIDGKEVVLTHNLHSVAHTFEDSFSAIEVGMGKKISLDPDEPVITEVPVDQQALEKLDVVNVAIAAGARAAKTKEAGPTPEDTQLMKSLNHRALKALGKDSSSDVRALEALAKISPDLVTSPAYESDFARLRLDRLVTSNYRYNSAEVWQLDKDIVTLVSNGDLELAKRLMTANPAELVNPNRSELSGVLIESARNNGDPSDTEQAQLALQIEAIQAEKTAALTAGLDGTLSSLVVSEDLKLDLKQGVLTAQDPEAALRSLQILQKAAGEDVDEAVMGQIVKQLLVPTGSCDMIVLDEVGPGAEAIMPFFLREDFRNLESFYFGATARNQMIRYPERAEQIMQLLAHPAMQPIIKDVPGSIAIFGALQDNDVAQETLARLDELGSLTIPLDVNQTAVVLGDKDAFQFALSLSIAEAAVPFFDGLGPDLERIAIDTGIRSGSRLQERIIENSQILAKETLPVVDLLKDARVVHGVALDLLSSEDPSGEIQVLNEAFTQTGLLGLVGPDGPAYTFVGSVVDVVRKSENPLETAQEFSKALTQTELLGLVGPDGPAQAFGPTVINLVLNSENPLETAQQACQQLLSNDPLWLRCYKISQIGVGSIEEVGYQTGLNIKEIPLSLPVPSLSNEEQLGVLRDETPTPFAELSVEQKRQVASLQELSDDQVAALREVAFSQLAPEYQRATLAFRLFETIALSRSSGERQAADQRNRSKTESEQWLEPGDLVHATNSPISLRAILTSGALAGETLGYKGRADSYPFNLDTVVVPDLTDSPDYVTKLHALKNEHYGQMALVFGRGPGALHRNEEFKGGNSVDHRLLLGGLPSTEISALLLRGEVTPETTASAKRVVVESGMYIPIVSPEGELLLTPEEFDRLQADENIQAVQPEIVDGAFERANSQGGSNEGAEFIVPQGEGNPPEHWYVKFGDDNPDRLWTEVLADRFYGAVTPDVVPETKPIIIEGRLARASRIATADEGSLTDDARNEAFVMDCLLGNWDAVYNDANIVMSGGHGLRIDTGNGFDFRARGGKKPEGTFTEVVPEIEVGTDRDDLGNGMRQMYPNLTDEQIDQQVASMKERLTDQVIDQLIDGIRRPSADRTELKRVIKARRDYIVGHFPAASVAA